MHRFEMILHWPCADIRRTRTFYALLGLVFAEITVVKGTTAYACTHAALTIILQPSTDPPTDMQADVGAVSRLVWHTATFDRILTLLATHHVLTGTI